jgi:lipoteichoic acid synthase
VSEESKTESESVSKDESKTESKVESAVESKVESGSSSKVESGASSKVESQDNPQSKPQSKPQQNSTVGGYNKMNLDLSKTSGKYGELNKYVSSLKASKKNKYTGIFKGKNLIMITAEAFTAEVIDPKRTPTLYRLANKGIQFTDFYQPSSAGTTGGEYQNIFGMIPTSGGKSFKNTEDNLNYMTIGSQLDRLGYYGQAFHNNTHTYYSRDITHNNLGYSKGFMGYGNGMEKYVKWQWPQSDLEMIEGTLPLYIKKQPFNVYYMSVSGHSEYAKGSNRMSKKNWSVVENLPFSSDVKGYLAANQELENALAYLVKTLEKKGIADDTVICIASDHFPYGLDAGGKLGNMPKLSELYGFKVNNYFERDHSRLIIWCGSLEKQKPIVVDTPTFSLDILPTLSNLFGTEFDSRLFPGRDVFSDADALVFNANYDWKTEYGTYISSKGKFTQTDKSVKLPKDYVKNMKAKVRNKIRYCKLALDTDYYRHLFS